MKKALTLALAFGFLSGYSAFAQEEGDEGKKKKKGGFSLTKIRNKVNDLRIGEKIGSGILNAVTAVNKTAELDELTAQIWYVNGVQPMDRNVSGDKYYPSNIREGDDAIGLMFNKGAGFPSTIKGTVTYNGIEMNTAGPSYMIELNQNEEQMGEIEVVTETGDKMKVQVLKGIGEVRIKSVNEESVLPIIDYQSDLVIDYEVDEIHEGAEISVKFLTDIAGARAFLTYYKFQPTAAGKVTIPKDSLRQQHDVGGADGAIAILGGKNSMLFEYTRTLKSDDFTSSGDMSAVVQRSVANAAMNVVVRPEGEGGTAPLDGAILVDRFPASDGEMMEYYIEKGNITYTAPIGFADNILMSSAGLVFESYYPKKFDTRPDKAFLDVSQVYRPITEEYKLPAMSSSVLEEGFQIIYQQVVEALESNLKAKVISPAKAVASTLYADFPEMEFEPEFMLKSYAMEEGKIVEYREVNKFFNGEEIQSDPDRPTMKLMNETETDALANFLLTLNIVEDKSGVKMVVPSLELHMTGRNEKTNEEVSYGDLSSYTFVGVPLDKLASASSGQEFANMLRSKQLVAALQQGIVKLKKKETELGYTAAWVQRQ